MKRQTEFDKWWARRRFYPTNNNAFFFDKYMRQAFQAGYRAGKKSETDNNKLGGEKIKVRVIR